MNRASDVIHLQPALRNPKTEIENEQLQSLA